MKALLLAGGHGTRLRPLTFTGNKHLLPIANKPMILYGLENLKRAGITDIRVILGPIKEGVEELLGDGSNFGVHIAYIQQPEAKGIPHAILLSRDFIGNDPFVVYLGDNLLKEGVLPFLSNFEKKNSDCTIGLARVSNPEYFGVAEFRNGCLYRLTEKPKKPRSNFALIGIFVFKSTIFDVIKALKPSTRGELEITQVIMNLLRRGKRIEVVRVKGWWKDTGIPEDLLEANRLVLDALVSLNNGTAEEGVSISGKVIIGKGTVIRKGAVVKGPAIIGSDCDIGEDSYIGPYTAIGDGCKVRNCEIANSIIMTDVQIECDKRIVDSIIGSHTRILDRRRTSLDGYRLVLGERSLAIV